MWLEPDDFPELEILRSQLLLLLGTLVVLVGLFLAALWWILSMFSLGG